MEDWASKFAGNLELNSAASESQIAAAEAHLQLSLPHEFREFLLHGNGGEGFVGQQYLMLWRVEDLAPLNRDYLVSEFAPGLLIFGSSGGGDAFGFDTRSPSMPIVRVPFVGMAWKDASEVAKNFRAFLEALYSQ